jgi:hypothetical protein
MPNDKKRRELASHQRDEARAIALQQASAGDTHRPVERPQPYGQEHMDEAVRLAVAKERERCAALADAFAAQPSRLLPDSADRAADVLELAAEIATRIAQGIRSQGN